MTMDTSTIPRKYVYTQSTAPTTTTEGALWYDTDNDTLYTYDGSSWNEISTDLSGVWENIAEQEIEIIELQANATVTPLDHDSLVSDTFSDADGYGDTVDTANTDSLFDTNKYSRFPQVSETSPFTHDNNEAGTVMSGEKVTTNSAVDIISLTKESGCNATKAYIHNAGKTLIDSATFVGDVATFATPVSLTTATDYFFTVDYEGGSFTARYGGSGSATDKTYLYWKESGYWNGGSWAQHQTGYNIVSAQIAAGTSDTSVRIDLPTITGTVTHTELIVNDPDREAGDEIDYNLIDTDTTTDSDLAVDTKNDLVTCDGTKITGGQININLKGKATTPTNGYPSVKTFALKIWKSAT